MYCMHCGREATPGDKECPGCGKAYKKKSAWWFFALVLLNLLLLIWAGVFLTSSSSGNPLVKKQIKAIREGRITEAYYEYTSKDFQATTPLSRFRAFVQQHPQFANNQSFTVVKESLGDQVGVVRTKLFSKDGSSLEVEFNLIKEGGKWKILSIELIDEQGSHTSINDEKQIRSLVEAQLKVLKEEDPLTAYYTFSSKEFQESTSLSAFEDFIHYFPAFVSYKTFTIGEFTVNPDRARLLVTLTKEEGEIVVEYALRKKEQEWKILGLQIVEKPEFSRTDTGFGPKEVVEAQLKAIRDHEFAKAYYEYTAKEYRGRVPYKDFVHFVKGEETLFCNRKSAFSTPELEESGARLMGTLTAMNLEQEQVAFELTEEGGHWKISHIHVSR